MPKRGEIPPPQPRRPAAPDLEKRENLGPVSGSVPAGGDPSRDRIETIARDGGVLTLRLHGELLYSNEGRFAEEILAASRGYDQVTLDLAGVEYVDSAGIALFVKLTRALRARGGNLTVTGVSGFVDSIFSLVSLRSVVDIR